MKFWIQWMVLGLVGTTLITGCESEEDDKINQAQLCIDSATPATANACLDSLGGITSAQSYILRCSANFLATGIDEEAIVNAMEDLNNTESAQDPMSTTMAYLSFGDQDSDVSAVATAVANCEASGSSTLKALANLASVATNINKILGSADPATFLTDIAAKDPSTYTPQELEAIGTSAIALAEVACAQNGSFEDNEVCDNLGDNTDPAAAAQELLNNLNTIDN